MKKIYTLLVLGVLSFPTGIYAQGTQCIDALVNYAGSFKAVNPTTGNCEVTLCVGVSGNPRPKQIQFQLTSPVVATIAMCSDGSIHTAPYDCGNGAGTFDDGTYCYTFILTGACPATVTGVVRGYTNASGGSGGLCTTINYPAVSLPVRLTSLTSQLTNEGVKVEWKTSEEVNSSYFEVQKSKDAIDFQTVGTVKAKGNSAQLNTYNFTDAYPTAGYNYYRLRMVDVDKRSELSYIIVAKYLPNGDIEVAPNPATANDIYINTKGFKVESIRLISLTGRELPIATKNFTDKIQILPAKNLPKGLYVVTLDTELGIQNHKVVIE